MLMIFCYKILLWQVLKKSVWDVIPSFSFRQNVNFDIMHDFLERVYGYDSCFLI